MNPYMNNPYPMQNQYVAQQQKANGITWVQGIEGAKAYQLMPNSNTILLDSENEGVFYIKTSDNVGMCNLRIFKYEEINATPTQQIDTSQFVTRAELQEIIDSIKGGNVDEQPISTTKRSTGTKSKSLITE